MSLARHRYQQPLKIQSTRRMDSSRSLPVEVRGIGWAEPTLSRGPTRTSAGAARAEPP